jgi:hypothetical protein
MALGNPFLITYAEDELVRSYEYVAGVFVPLGVSAAYPHNPPAVAISVGNVDPQFEWIDDDAYALFMYSISADQNGYRTFDPAANEIGSFNGGIVGQASGGYLTYVKDNDTSFYRYPTNIHANTVALKVDSVGDIATGPTPQLNANDVNTDFSSSPNGDYYTVCGLTGNPRMIERTSAPGVYPPTFTAPFDIVFQFDPEILRWSGDNATVIVLSRNERIGQVYFYDGDIFTKMQDLQLIADVAAMVHKAEVAGDGRMLAVSFVNGTTYTTKLYRRTSGYMLPVQEIANFGKALTWSADGKVLVDAALVRAVIAEPGGTYSNHDSAMINIAPDIRIAKMSLAPTDQIANPLVYLAALEPFATCGIAWDNLKFTLLTSSAVFDETDTTLAEVTNNGAWEVTGGAWPAGGIMLSNVTEGMGATNYEFLSDPVTWLTFGSGMAWRYGVLYDATNGIPLVCFDYFGERIVASNREVHFNFPSDVFLRLTR